MAMRWRGVCWGRVWGFYFLIFRRRKYSWGIRGARCWVSAWRFWDWILSALTSGGGAGSCVAIYFLDCGLPLLDALAVVAAAGDEG